MSSLASEPDFGAVLLAAGRGSRLEPLTSECHKSLLPLAGSTPLDLIVEELRAVGVADIVVVLGHMHAEVERHLRDRYDGLRYAYNANHANDMNIGSTELGVSSLRAPERGYLLVETDVVLEPSGWSDLFTRTERTDGCWYVHGRFSETLRGGALKPADDGSVAEVVYSPVFDDRYDGWSKLLGMLYVAPGLVPGDRSLRQAAMARTTAQYYMTPWVGNPAVSRFRFLDLSANFAASFNDEPAYRRADAEYKRRVGTVGIR